MKLPGKCLDYTIMALCFQNFTSIRCKMGQRVFNNIILLRNNNLSEAYSVTIERYLHEVTKENSKDISPASNKD